MASSGDQEVFEILRKDNCSYTACYCEENVWLLCDQIRRSLPQNLDDFFVVFISNSDKKIPLWRQTASKAEDGCVVWDYHVILLFRDIMEYKVFDLDTTLPFPCSFYEYSHQAIRDEDLMLEQYHRCFRVVEAKEFLAVFASDRTHMLNPEHKWLAPPPSYPCIQTADCTNNLASFICMESGTGYGDVMTHPQFVSQFTTDGL